jgi:hypothetical protein
MEELRKTPRMKALKGARILFNGGYSTRDCMVRNLSDHGARLHMGTTTGLPDDITLLFENGSKLDCHVRWRKVNDLGVEF